MLSFPSFVFWHIAPLNLPLYVTGAHNVEQKNILRNNNIKLMRLRKENRVLDYLKFKTNILTTVNGQKISADFKISFNCMIKGASNNTFRLLRHWPDVNLTTVRTVFNYLCNQSEPFRNTKQVSLNWSNKQHNLLYSKCLHLSTYIK